MPNDYTLFPFQAEGVKWIQSARTNTFGFDASPLHGVIEDEMGLGKTAQALAAIEPSVKVGKRFLIIVPGATIIQWQKNWDRWILDMEPDDWGTGQLIAISGSKEYIPKDECVIISHNLLAKVDAVKRLAKANFDGIIIDEIHKFGTRGTRRIKQLWALVNLSPDHISHARIGLTGTPTRNWAHEIFNIAHFIAPAYFRNFEEFARRYLTYNYKALYNPQQFHRDFAPYYIRRTVAEVQKDLPKCRRTKLYCEITDPLLRMIYNKNLDLMANFVNSGSKIDAFSLLGYIQSLRRITGLAKAKEPGIIGPMLDYLESEPSADNMPRKIVVGVHHHFVSERLANSTRDYKTFLINGTVDRHKKEQIKLDFMRYEGPAILQLSIKAGGEGIDGLQECCQKSYVFERQWNGADELQFEKRIHRTGQKLPVSVEYTIAMGTVDEFFDEMIEMKRKITNSVEDPNWENDPAFMRQLAEKVIQNPLATTGDSARRIRELNEEQAEEESELAPEGSPLPNFNKDFAKVEELISLQYQEF